MALVAVTALVVLMFALLHVGLRAWRAVAPDARERIRRRRDIRRGIREIEAFLAGPGKHALERRARRPDRGPAGPGLRLGRVSRSRRARARRPARSGRRRPASPRAVDRQRHPPPPPGAGVDGRDRGRARARWACPPMLRRQARRTETAGTDAGDWGCWAARGCLFPQTSVKRDRGFPPPEIASCGKRMHRSTRRQPAGAVTHSDVHRRWRSIRSPWRAGMLCAHTSRRSSAAIWRRWTPSLRQMSS